MAIDLIPNPDFTRRVKQYYPNAFPKWNRRFKRWDIVDKHPHGYEFILMAVRNDDDTYRPLDSRTIKQLRFMRWFNNKPHRMKLMLWDAVQDDFVKKEKADREHENTIRDIAKEIAPLLRKMQRDTAYSAYSKPVPFNQGFGSGIYNQQLGRKFVRTA